MPNYEKVNSMDSWKAGKTRKKVNKTGKSRLRETNIVGLNTQSQFKIKRED
jgi:hypothetical protein